MQQTSSHLFNLEKNNFFPVQCSCKVLNVGKFLKLSDNSLFNFFLIYLLKFGNFRV
jgi:hypothetical protein